MSTSDWGWGEPSGLSFGWGRVEVINDLNLQGALGVPHAVCYETRRNPCSECPCTEHRCDPCPGRADAPTLDVDLR